MTSKTLVLAPDIKLDASLATQTIAALARKGGGKTYLAQLLAEFMALIGCPVIVLDTVGNWWGLTLAANGKDPGLPFLVLGGGHGAIDLPPTSGAAVARLVIEKNVSVVLDVSRMRKSDMLTFVADFTEAFFELIVKHPMVRHFICEEMQRVAPQTFSGTQQNRTFRAFEDLIRLGRNYGLGFTMLSQRPQSINKELLSQVEVLFAGQMVEAHGRKALDEWVVQHDVKLKTMFAEIASLSTGEFFLWSPSWLKVFRKIKVPKKWTYDASSTPTIGSQVIQASKVATAWKDQLDEIRKLLTGPEEAEPVYDEAPRYSADELDAANRRADELSELLDKASSEVERKGALISRIHETLDTLLRSIHEELEQPDFAVATDRSEETQTHREVPVRNVQLLVPTKRAPPETIRVKSAQLVGGPRATAQSKGTAEGLGKCARAIMTTLLQVNKPLDKPRLARRSGYSPGTGGFNNALSELRTLGWMDGSGELRATPEGKKGYEALYGRVPPLPSGRQLFDYWLAHPRLGKCDRSILTVLRGTRSPMTKDQIAAATDYSAGTGGFNNSLSNLRTLGLIEGRPQISIAPELR
jgi:hypothetical protein